jgi:hypothetical protein
MEQKRDADGILLLSNNTLLLNLPVASSMFIKNKPDLLKSVTGLTFCSELIT